MTFRANNALADSTVNIETLDTVKAFSKSGVEVEAFDGDGNAVELNNVLSGGALDNDLSACSIGVELVEFADASEAFS